MSVVRLYHCPQCNALWHYGPDSTADEEALKVAEFPSKEHTPELICELCSVDTNRKEFCSGQTR
jgi:hypothetical protein